MVKNRIQFYLERPNKDQIFAIYVDKNMKLENINNKASRESNDTKVR